MSSITKSPHCCLPWGPLWCRWREVEAHGGAVDQRHAAALINGQVADAALVGAGGVAVQLAVCGDDLAGGKHSNLVSLRRQGEGLPVQGQLSVGLSIGPHRHQGSCGSRGRGREEKRGKAIAL